MSAKKADVPKAIEELLKEKASHSPCTYKVSAIAFDAKGDILGHVTNSHSKRYSSLIKTIVICRVGRSGNLRPIDPCPACQRVAAKYGIKIVSLMPGNGHQHEGDN